MYSLSDHYIFSDSISYETPNGAPGNIKITNHTQYDITPIFILILILTFFFVLKNILINILVKIKDALSNKFGKKTKNRYDTNS